MQRKAAVMLGRSTDDLAIHRVCLVAEVNGENLFKKWDENHGYETLETDFSLHLQSVTWLSKDLKSQDSKLTRCL